MAKNRMINTRFWSDNYIANLDPLEKLLFLYLITNQYTNICGIYEIPLKQIALDTGIDRENLEKVLLPRFKKAEKIFYIDGWIYVKNFLKHQKSSGNVSLGIENGQKEVPSEIMAKIKAILDTPPSQVGHSHKPEPKPKPKLELKSELSLNQSEPGSQEEKDVNVIIPYFEPINPSWRRFYSVIPQRAAIKRLLKIIPKEELIASLQVLPQIVCRPYAPRATTPIQLEDKLGALKIFIEQEKTKSQSKISIYEPPKQQSQP